MVERIVTKIWGSEEWIVNGEYCGKILKLNKGYRCSMHYHKNKEETFYLLSGKVLMEVENMKHIMTPGNTQLIRPNQKHRFTGLEYSKMIEFSTHYECKDSYRIELSGEVNLEDLLKTISGGLK